jgi:hypothetical protein
MQAAKITAHFIAMYAELDANLKKFLIPLDN